MPDGEPHPRECTRCGRALDLAEFAFKSKVRGIRQSRCRQCFAGLGRQYYERSPHRYKARAQVSKALTRRANRAALREYLTTQSCMDCGLADAAVLEFDHRENKHRNVADLVSIAASWRTITAEMAKCDVVCANCHRRRTARSHGWHKHGERAKPELPPLPQRGTPEYERVKSLRSTLSRRFRNRQRLRAYLQTRSCEECGTDDPLVLEFDHLADKVGNVSELLLFRGWSIVAAEIRKCRVLCANCHRRATAMAAGRER